MNGSKRRESVLPCLAGVMAVVGLALPGEAVAQSCQRPPCLSSGLCTSSPAICAFPRPSDEHLTVVGPLGQGQRFDAPHTTCHINRFVARLCPLGRPCVTLHEGWNAGAPWTVPACHPPGMNELVLEGSHNGGQCVVKRSNPFEVRPGPSTCIWWADVDHASLFQRQTQVIRWGTQNQSWVNLYIQEWNGASFLYKDMRPWGGAADGWIATIHGAQAVYHWPVPRDLPDRAYRFEVLAAGPVNQVRGAFTRHFEVRPVPEVGPVDVSPTALRRGDRQRATWSSRNQQSFEIARCNESRSACSTLRPRGDSSATSFEWTVDDSVPAGRHVLSVRIWTRLGDHADRTSAVFTVGDNIVSFAEESSTRNERDGTAVVAVRLQTSDGRATDRPVSVTWETTPGTARAGEDYDHASGSVAFPAGTGSGATRTLSVSLRDDSTHEPREAFSLRLTGADGATLGFPLRHTVTVEDDDPRPNDAAFVGQVVAAEMVAGRTQAVSVTMRNTGSNTWTTGSRHHLGAQSPDVAPFPWGLSRVLLPHPVPPGGQVTFSFNLTAPAAAGTYQFHWRMVQDGVEWFGQASQSVGVTVRVLRQNDSSFVSQSVPAELVAGQTAAVSLTMRNEGTATWTSAARHALGSALGGDGPTWSVWGINRVPLPSPVPPGAEATFRFSITAPTAAGEQPFEWRMVQDGVEWFGPASPRAFIQVTLPPEPVAWTSARNATVTGGLLTKVGAAAWDGGAISTTLLSRGPGWVEHRAGPPGVHRAFGLGHGDTNQSLEDLEFAFVLMDGGTLGIYEAGELRGTFGLYRRDDLLRVSVDVRGRVSYSRNGERLRGSDAAVRWPLVVDTSLLEPGASLGDVLASGFVVGEVVSWTRRRDVQVTGDALVKTGTAVGWNAGAVSTRAVGAGGGFVEFTPGPAGTHRAVGLGRGDSDPGLDDIEFAMVVMDGGSIGVYESGVLRATFTAAAPSDRLRIAVEGGRVRYYRNGARLHESSTSPTFPLVVDTSLLEPGAAVSAAVLSGDLVDSGL